MQDSGISGVSSAFDILLGFNLYYFFHDIDINVSSTALGISDAICVEVISIHFSSKFKHVA